MPGTSPNFADWNKLSTYSIWEAACLISGFDPRAMSDVTDEFGDGLELNEEIKILISAVYAKEIALALEQKAPFSRGTIIRRDSLIDWLKNSGYSETLYGLTHTESISNFQDTPITDRNPADDFVADSGTQYPWVRKAREIAEELLRDNEKLKSLNQLQIAAKVREKMVQRIDQKEAGLTGRGRRVPSAETIKRHALSGLGNPK